MEELGSHGQPHQLFPAAAQPNLIRAQQKDELYLQYLTDACHDAVRRVLGPHRALHWASETCALAKLLYLALTTGSGLQTLGEEYCDILQNDDFAAWQQVQAATRADTARQQQQDQQQQTLATAALLLQRVTAMARQLGSAVQQATQPVTRHLPAVTAFLSEHGGVLMRIHLALFYVFGLYYQLPKRITGVRYLFLGRPFEGRPSYRFLGFLLFTQLGISGLLWLLRRHDGLPSLLTGAGEQLARRPMHAVLLAEDGKPLEDMVAGVAAPEGGRPAAGAAGDASREAPSSRKCPLCLSVRTCPTATPCGHVFCWQCIADWSNQKPECPLCRADFTPSLLVCVRHADF